MGVTYALPVFNKARFLPGVLAAVFSECERTGGEVLALDDASTDDSAALLEAAEARGLRRLSFPANRGVMAATDALISAAAFPYLRLVDADDVIWPGSTARLAAALEGSGAVLAFGTEAGPRAPAPEGPAMRWPRPVRAMLRAQPFNPSQTLIMTATAKALLPLPVEIRTAQDFWLGLRLAIDGDFLACPFPAAAVAQDAEGLSRRPAAVFADTCRLMARALPRLSPADRRFALARSAARARRYFRRERPGLLGGAERARLFAWSLGLAGGTPSAAALEALAALYERAI